MSLIEKALSLFSLQEDVLSYIHILLPPESLHPNVEDAGFRPIVLRGVRFEVLFLLLNKI